MNRRNSIILFVVLIAFWQIAFEKYMLQWDILDISLPWRYFIDQCMAEGILPLWNPFMNNGFPQQADPQTWYPVSATLSLFGTYGFRMLHVEFILHLLIAGFGFYALLRETKVTQVWVLILGACAYMCSGFFIGNAQHLGWIISAAWIPWIFTFNTRFFSEGKTKWLIATVICMFFLLTGGYPGLFIVMIYLLFFYWLREFIIQGKQKIRSIFFAALVGLIGFIALSSVVWYSSFEIKEFIYRSSLTSEQTLTGSLSPSSLVSVAFPFMVANDMNFFGVELSVANSSFGFICLLLLCYGIVTQKWKELKWFGLACVFLLFALGNHLPFRSWLYHLPMFDVFRFPSIFRLFFILFSLISVCLIISKTDWKIEVVKFRKFLFVICGLLCLLIISIFSLDALKDFLNKDLVSFIRSSSITERLFIQALNYLLLLIPLLFLLFRETRIIRTLAFFILLDCIVAVQFNAASTVYMKKDFSLARTEFKKLEDGFSAPSMDEVYFNSTSPNAGKIEGLWRNMNVFFKKPSFYGYSPYYFSSTAVLEKDPIREKIHSSGWAGISEVLKAGKFSTDYVSANIEIKSFSPNSYTFIVQHDNPGWFVLHQNYYPGWKAEINGSPTEIRKVNYSEMAVKITPGDNVISFKFESTFTRPMFYVSLITFIVLLMVIIFFGNLQLFPPEKNIK